MTLYEIRKIAAAIDSLLARGLRGVLVTIVSTKGSTYRRAGARCVIGEDGSAYGAISGGCVERDLAERAKLWLADMKPRIVAYDSTASDDVVFGLGLGCRGKLEMIIHPFDATNRPPLPVEAGSFSTAIEGSEVLVETVEPQRRLAVFGAGADVEPVATIARALGWDVDVITAREFDVMPWHAAVVMTHNFLRDVDIMAVLLRTQIPYVGILGPKSRGDEILTQLGDINDEARARVFNPIGLDLGGEAPEDIALSIVAEIQAVLNGKEANSLRDKQGSIHSESSRRSPGRGLVQTPRPS
jgi:xanthine/CO dehydrogenase XdhC/CoxF family maturation factor